MAINPLRFAENFMAQPYPTQGMAPSAIPVRTGGVIVQAGSGSDGLGKTGASMWARIADAVPFGWSLLGTAQATKVANTAGKVAAVKMGEGAQAVEGKVKSVTEPIKSAFTGVVSYSKWVVIGLVAVAFIVFAAQVKSLVKS